MTIKSSFLDRNLSDRIASLIAILVILIFAVVNVSSVRRHYSETTDEDKHYLYGERILEGDPSRFNPSTMPIVALNAVPKMVAPHFPDGRLKNFLNRLSAARMITVVFSCLTAYLVFHWARLLYGYIPALFSLALYVLDPNIIAHSQLVTTDIYLTGSMVFAFYALWRFAHERNVRNGLLCLTLLGICQLTKYNAIILFPLFFMALALFDLRSQGMSVPFLKKIKGLIPIYSKYAALAILTSILIINLGFLFNKTFMKFGEYTFHSEILQSVQADFPILYHLPVPVPEPFLSGFDSMNNTEQTGSALGNMYLLGEARKGEGFAGYYFVASLFKVPISTQVIIIMAFGVYFLRQDLKKNFFNNEVFLLISVMFFAIYFNFFFKTQVGIRYYLPVFPFLYIFSGILFLNLERFSRIKKVASIALLVYLFVSVASYYPYHLSYFNEIVWNRMHAYKYLADSNLDWGQDRNELKQYLLAHPDALYNPNDICSGRLVVRINDLVGVTQDPEKFAWLRDNFEPTERIGYSILVYIIRSEDINQLCATTDYCGND